MTRLKLFILLLTFLFNSSIFASEENYGLRTLALLDYAIKNDFNGYKNRMISKQDLIKLAESSLTDKTESDKILKNLDKFDDEIYASFISLSDKLKELNISAKSLNYVSNIIEADYYRKKIPILRSVLVFSADNFEYEIESEFSNFLSIDKIFRINSRSIVNISKVTIKKFDEYEKEIQNFTITRKTNEERLDFKKRVINSYLEELINGSSFHCSPGTQYINENKEIIGLGSINFFFNIANIKISGGNLFGYSNLSSESGFAEFKLVLYNKNDIKFYEENYSAKIYNDGSGIHPIFKEYELGNINIYENVTVILELNGKIIFSRTDLLSNFTLGTLSISKKNNRYYYIPDYSDETKNRMKTYYELLLSY